MRRFVSVVALACATSCTPPAAVRQTVAVPPPQTGRALLARLDLAVPKDLADQPLPHAAAHALPLAAPAFAAGALSDGDAARARDCLTAAIYYEARSEPIDGQRAVAQVVLNRVRDRAFPASVCGVVYQGSARRTGCQFSFTCDGSMARPRDPLAWGLAEDVARAALGGAVYAAVGSATHYHAASILPWWSSSLARIGAVGGHVFYRWASGLERALAFRQTYAGREPAIESIATVATGGVEVHYGDDVAPGVTIHRGLAAATVPVAARSYSASGVRIHLGDRPGEPPRDDGAIVADET